VNYELPNVPEDYVHRIGRTARAGAKGRAVSLVAPDEAPLVRDIERTMSRKIEFAPTPPFETGSEAEARPARQSHAGRSGHTSPAQGKARRSRSGGRGRRNAARAEDRALT
jgi:ATP-dependent RNA helicase RhlE